MTWPVPVPVPVTVSATEVDAVTVPDVPVMVNFAPPVGVLEPTVTESVLPLVELAGLKVALAPVGRPATVKPTDPVKPPAGVTVIASLPLPP